MKYTIARDSNLQHFTREVEQLANGHGWEPLGGVATEKGKNHEGNEVTFFVQALILKEDSEG
jgi:hypothetical protein